MSAGTSGFSGLSKYYSEARGAGAALVAAFQQARSDFISEDIEWVEPFATLHTAEDVQRTIIAGHTSGLADMHFEVDSIYETGESSVCVVGRMDATFPPNVNFVTRFVHVWDFEADRAIRFRAFAENGPDMG